MTSTLGIWMLTGYGAIQLSVHCDHLLFVLFWRTDSLTLRRKAGRFDHPASEKKMCVSIYGHGKRENLTTFHKILQKSKKTVSAVRRQ